MIESLGLKGTMSLLRGRVAVVTGASRGVGKGIALALGEAGATVYVTGRSDPGGTTEGLPGSVRETADAVTQRGGQGVAVRCDHTVDAEVEALFARVTQEQGRLDLLVNNVWGGYEQQDWSRFGAPFWEQPLRHWSGMFESGVRAHLVVSKYSIPLNRSRIEIPLDGGDGRVRTDYRRATLTQCA